MAPDYGADPVITGADFLTRELVVDDRVVTMQVRRVTIPLQY